MDYAEIVVPVAFFGVTYLIIKTILDNRTKHKLIEKGLVDEKVKYLFAEKLDSQFLSSLKWGMVLIGLGLAVLVGELVQTERSEEVTVGAMFVFAGLALLIHYGVASRLSKKSKTNGSGTTG